MWKLTKKLCFQVFLGFVYRNQGVWVRASEQNDWDRSLSLKIKEFEPNQPFSVFWNFGVNMFQAKWWILVLNGFSQFACQRKPRVYAGRCAKNWGDRLYTLPKNVVEQNGLGSHLLIHWRIHTLNFCQKSPMFAQFNDSGTQIHTIQNYSIEMYPVSIH